MRSNNFSRDSRLRIFNISGAMSTLPFKASLEGRNFAIKIDCYFKLLMDASMFLCSSHEYVEIHLIIAKADGIETNIK